ncbi:hypothetical protein IWX64_002325 [Arthrobacter sp. CAN_A212]|uniref:DUF2087 domain-containing protein n=1 Tax=unclassified Arthrobacter TaxID=235627 RepID=UPI0018CAB6AE|nr:DUF2087 domain-containing protein [Arthrobacter sp. CAN_C5]MBP2217697.1 hypothetical protein [Arthrobacter sp. CAN_C5]
MTPSWQKAFSTLSAPRLRELYAAAVLGQHSDASSKELEKLHAAALLNTDGTVNADLFQEVLGATARKKPQGVDRFFLDGQLDGLPRNPAERTAVLEHLTERLIPADQELSEREVNLVLATVTRDIPALRRALVDQGHLARRPDGTGYRRA